MRKSNRPGGEADLPKSLIKAVEEVVSFTPTDAHRRAKSSLWTRIGDDPLVDPASITSAAAAQYSNDSRVLTWWSEPGFKDWLLNTNENQARLDYLVSLGLDAAEEIIRNDDPKAQSARVNMIKALFELKGKQERQANERKFLDSSIQGMDKLELQAYLQRQGVSLSLSGSKEPTNNTKKEEVIDAEVK